MITYTPYISSLVELGTQSSYNKADRDANNETIRRQVNALDLFQVVASEKHRKPLYIPFAPVFSFMSFCVPSGDIFSLR